MSAPDFTGLADDLVVAWSAPGVTMRAGQQLVRALVTNVIADVDEAARDVILTIHWRGGQHSRIRRRQPKTGELWLPDAGRSACGHGTNGRSLVGCGYRRLAQPDEPPHRSGQDLDAAPRRSIRKVHGCTPTVLPRKLANGSP